MSSENFSYFNYLPDIEYLPNTNYFNMAPFTVASLPVQPVYYATAIVPDTDLMSYSTYSFLPTPALQHYPTAQTCPVVDNPPSTVDSAQCTMVNNPPSTVDDNLRTMSNNSNYIVDDAIPTSSSAPVYTDQYGDHGTNLSIALSLYQRKLWKEFQAFVREHTFNLQDHCQLQDLWKNSLYELHLVNKGREVNSLSRFRMRKKYPEPSTIFNGETSYNLKKSSRNYLIAYFNNKKYPSKEEKLSLAAQLGVGYKTICSFFRNRRARLRKSRNSVSGSSGNSSISADIGDLFSSCEAKNFNEVYKVVDQFMNSS